MQIKVKVINGTTQEPVQGARVFVYGTQKSAAPLQTDAAGEATAEITGNLSVIQVSASGYKTESYLQAGTLALSPAESYKTLLRFVVSPTEDPVNPAAGAPSTSARLEIRRDASNGSEVETLTVGSDGSISSNTVYEPGEYWVTISKAGFEDVSEPFTVESGDVQKTFTLAAKATTTAPAVDVTNAIPEVAAAPIAAPTKEVDDSEFIYPNSEDGKYFQAPQARMYIGNLFIDELALCQFQLADNRIPIYPYRSEFFAAVGKGKSLVQGQLAVNFISEGYLYTVLKEYERMMLQKASTTKGALDDKTVDEINGLINKKKTTTDPAELARINARLNDLASQGKNSLTFVKTAIANNRKQLSAYRTFDYQNACYLDIPFTIEVEFEGAGRVVKRKLETCFLGANDFQFSHDGKTILDTYGFIARKLA